MGATPKLATKDILYMTIHHSTAKKAEKLGIVLSDNLPAFPFPLFFDQFPADTVQAHWPKWNVYAFGVGAKPALEQAEALIAIKALDPEYVLVNIDADPFMVRVFDSTERQLAIEPMLPSEALAALMAGGDPWRSTTVPLDGGEAHKLGLPITSNPFPESDDEYSLWDATWEASADEASELEADEGDAAGSVVKNEYRIRYAEAGHPNHCGDWLANTLNNLVLGKSATDIERLEDIFAANGVDTTKYNHSTNGWQGRIRMTGRNMMARRIYMAGGIMHVPGLPDFQAPPDWMAAQRFKAPAPAAAPTPAEVPAAPEQVTEDA